MITLRQKIATGIALAGIGLAVLCGGGCSVQKPITQEQTYTPEQIKAWYDYMERNKQRKEAETRAWYSYMERGNQQIQQGIQKSTQQQTNLSAQAEYEQALAAYNKALEERDNARTAQAMPRAYPNAALGLLVDLGAQNMVTESERELEIARERLERAKARINHSEW